MMFLINEVQTRHGTVRVLPVNHSKFLTFSVGDVIFMDSNAFLKDSLENLVKDVLKQEDDFKYVYSYFKDKPELLPYVKEKSCFPYEYFNSIDRFQETKIPSREDFYDNLNNKECSVQKYEKVSLLWELLGGKFENLHDFYLILDVLLLACVCEKFKNTCHKDLKLDPFNYISLAAFTWDAALLYTREELELFDNEEMYTFLESSCRGGIVQASKRYAEANNPYMLDGFNPQEAISYLIQLDSNNLYALSLRSHLPYKSFKWVICEKLRGIICSEDFILGMKNDRKIGYIYEVDIEIPKELHEMFSDLPLLPENISVTNDMLSDFQNEHWPKIPPKGHERLTLNLFNKQNYVLHYRTLKFCIQQGLKVKKFHRILQFEQKAWLRPYIDRNTKKRMEASELDNKFLQNLWKVKYQIRFYILFHPYSYALPLFIFVIKLWILVSKAKERGRERNREGI